MSSQVTEEQVRHMHKHWRGNGGRSSIYNLCHRHSITVNEAYVILSMNLNDAVKRAAAGKKFVSYKETTPVEAVAP